MPRMLEVVIDSVRVSLTNQQRIVVLREVNAERYLPIWIGPMKPRQSQSPFRKLRSPAHKPTT